MTESKSRSVSHALGIAALIMIVLGVAFAHAQPSRAATWQTQISTGRMLGTGFDPHSFYVRGNNGAWQPTYAGLPLAGRLMNFRAANAMFDDEKRSDDFPDANTDAFISNFDAYRAHGILAMTVSLQGGNPGYKQGELVSAFNPDGSLKSAWLDRTSRVIEAADACGMVIILSYFYVRQDQVLVDEAAVKQAVVNATDWLISKNYRNVIIEIANEYPLTGYDHPIIRNNTVAGGIGELINLAKSRFAGLDWRLPVTAARDGIAFKGGIAETADLAVVHGRGYTDQPGTLDTYEAMKRIYDQNAVPVVMTEDDNGQTPDETTLANDTHALDDAIRAGGSWGLHWKLCQNFPFGWNLGDASQLTTTEGYFHAILDVVQDRAGMTDTTTPVPAVFTPTVDASTATETATRTQTETPMPAETSTATPTIGDTGQYSIVVSLDPTRSNPSLLNGSTIGGLVYIFTTPDTNVISVRFLLDNRVVRTEGSAPFDYAGGTVATAQPWNTANVARGQHRITAVLTLADGTTSTLTATFLVNNSP
jgi:hypothetical protein